MKVKFPINKCPLCNKDIFVYGPRGWYRCVEMVKMGPELTPHYQVETEKDIHGKVKVIQHVCVPPLLLNTYSDTWEAELFEIKKDGSFKLLYSFEALPITPDLLQRLRKLIIFT